MRDNASPINALETSGDRSGEFSNHAALRIADDEDRVGASSCSSALNSAPLGKRTGWLLALRCAFRLLPLAFFVFSSSFK
jgi:hypothetical protein